MSREDISAEKSGSRWFINLDWFQRNNRSFSVLAWGCLCPACRERLKAEPEEIAATDLLATFKDCCSKPPGFIGSDMPVMESVFHLFLANGNQPLDLVELSRQLNEGRGGDSYRTSPEILSRLLENDHYYGLGQVQD